MKTLSFAMLLVASLMFVPLGCSDNASLPSSSSNQETSMLGSLSKNGPVIHAAIGSLNGTYGLPKNIVYTFAAHQFQDGSYDGAFTVNGANAFGHARYQKWNGRVLFLKVYSDLVGYG